MYSRRGSGSQSPIGILYNISESALIVLQVLCGCQRISGNTLAAKVQGTKAMTQNGTD